MMAGATLVAPDPVATWAETQAAPGRAAAAGPIMAEEPFGAEEAGAMAASVPQRRHEFHTGRRLARQALQQLGCPPVTIPVGRSREPVWPRGFVGSISHNRDCCIALVGRSDDYLAIGVDVERAVTLPADVARLVCRTDERPCDDAMTDLLRFVAKEAFYKAYFPIVGQFLDFHDVYVELDLDASTFVAGLAAADKPGLAGHRYLGGHLARPGNQVVATVWLAT